MNIIIAIIIFGGAIIIFSSIKKSSLLKNFLPFVPKKNRVHISKFLNFNKILMYFFLMGYLAVGTAQILNIEFATDLFVAIIFLSGAFFVYLGVSLQTKMLEEIQSTLNGIVPICANCKNIREEGSDPKNKDSWTDVETYISEHSNADFSHGICPDCCKQLYPDSQIFTK